MDTADVHGAKQKARRTADRAGDHPALTLLARGGFIVLGVLHILIGWIAVQIATGTTGEEASNSGALETIAQAPGGQVALWAAVLALVALALWRLTQLFTGGDAKEKAKGGVTMVVYLSLAATTATFAAGGRTSDGETATDVTATVLAQPWGAALVIAAGLVVIAMGVHNAVRGATKKFREDLEAGAGTGDVGSAVVAAGMVGYVARGVAFTVLGGLIVWAGWANDPEEAGGLDAALRTLGQQPAGTVLLIAVGAGLALYGVYSLARARYVRM